MPKPPATPEYNRVYYTVRSPWEWVMKHVASADTVEMNYVDVPANLPSGQAKVTVTATPNTARRRSAMKKGPSPCTLRLEACNETKLLWALHGTSAALDGLEDKDELVRTMQRCRCEHLNIGPPSILLKWDITKDECKNYVPSLPVLPGRKDEVEVIAVLKEPTGSRGEGIYFVSTADEAFAHIDRHRKQALEEPHFLDQIMDQKGRMPAWVLQAEVYPPLLIQGGRKFSIRSNIAVVEKLFSDKLLDIYIHNRPEVRIAAVPVEEEDPTATERDPLAHITNGATSDTTERVLLASVPELASLQSSLQVFLAKALHSFMPDIIRRVGYSASQDNATTADIRKFAIAGVDIMVTDQNRFYLLEVNVNPVAPTEDCVNGEFKEHLIGWMSDLVNLTLGRPSPNFVSIHDIAPQES